MENGGPRLLIHHPRNAKAGRLVVFSHGALAEPQVYDLILSHWASHGFVVVSPLHDDSVIARGLAARARDRDGHVTLEFEKILNDTQAWERSEEHTSELQSLMLISYAVFF